MIFSIAAVSAAEDVTSDLAESQTIDDAVELTVDEDAGVQEDSGDDAVLADDGDVENFSTIQQKIDKSYSTTGSVILTKDVVRTENDTEIVISDKITIVGTGYTINANNFGRIFNITPTGSLTLTGITLINGNATDGGAIYNEGSLSMSDTTFRSNNAANNGGAIYSTGTILSEEGSYGPSTFAANTAGNFGGAIYSTGKITAVSISVEPIYDYTYTENNETGMWYQNPLDDDEWYELESEDDREAGVAYYDRTETTLPNTALKGGALYLDEESEANFTRLYADNATVFNYGKLTLSNSYLNLRDDEDNEYENSYIYNEGNLTVNDGSSNIYLINNASGIVSIIDSEAEITVENYAAINLINNTHGVYVLNNGTVFAIENSQVDEIINNGEILIISNIARVSEDEGLFLIVGTEITNNLNASILGIGNSLIEINENYGNIGVIENCTFEHGLVNYGNIAALISSELPDQQVTNFGNISNIKNYIIGDIVNGGKIDNINNVTAFAVSNFALVGEDTLPGIIGNITESTIALVDNKGNIARVANSNITGSNIAEEGGPDNWVSINNDGNIDEIENVILDAQLLNNADIGTITAATFNDDVTNEGNITSIEGKSVFNGALSNVNDAVASIKDSTFTNAVFNTGYTLAISNCEFKDIQATAGVVSNNGILTISDSVFTNCSVEEGFYLIENGEDGNLTLTKNVINNDTAGILNKGIINTVYVNVTTSAKYFNLDSQGYPVDLNGGEIILFAFITDDNGNLIKEESPVEFVVGNSTFAASYDDDVYWAVWESDDVEKQDYDVLVNVDKENYNYVVANTTVKTTKGTFTELQYLVDYFRADNLDYGFTYNADIDGNLTTIIVDVPILGGDNYIKGADEDVFVNITGNGSAPIFILNTPCILDNLALSGFGDVAVIVNSTAVFLNDNNISKTTPAIVVTEEGNVANAVSVVTVNGVLYEDDENPYIAKLFETLTLNTTIVDINDNLISWNKDFNFTFSIDDEGQLMEIDKISATTEDNSTFTAVYTIDNLNALGNTFVVGFDLPSDFNGATPSHVYVDRYDTNITVLDDQPLQIISGEDGTLHIVFIGVTEEEGIGVIDALRNASIMIGFQNDDPVEFNTTADGTFDYIVNHTFYNGNGNYQVKITFMGDLYNAEKEVIAEVHVGDAAAVNVEGPANWTINWTENAPITFNVTADGKLIENVNLTVYLDGVEVYTVISYGGTGSYTFEALPAGVYEVKVELTKALAKDYVKATNITTLIVKQNTTVVSIESAGDIADGANATITINTNVAGDYTIFDGETPLKVAENLTVGENTVSFALPGVGNHLITVYYAGSENYTDALSNNVTIKVKQVPKVVITPSASEVLIGENVTVSIVTDVSGNYSIVIGDLVNEVKELTAGEARVYNLTEPAAGTYIITVGFNETDECAAQEYVANFTVLKFANFIDVVPVSTNITYGEDIVLNVTVGVNGTYYVIINNVPQEINLTAGNVTTVTVSDVAAGEHTIIVYYPGTEIYEEVTNDTYTAYVAKASIEGNLTITVDDVTYGDKITITVVSPVDVPGEVDLLIGDEIITKAIENATAVFTVDSTYLGVGNYTFGAIFTPVDYESLFASANVVVSKATPSINVFADSEVVYPNSVVVKVVSNVAGNYTVSVGDSSQVVTLEANVAQDITFSGVQVGTYEARADYAETENYNAASGAANVTVSSNVNPDDPNTFDIPTSSETDSPTFSINLPSNATGTFTVNVDGKNYTANLTNGKASITVPGLSEGNHNVSVSYSGDANYGAVSKSTTINVHIPVYAITAKLASSVVYSATAKLTGTVTKDGKALANAEVTITYNGKTYKVKTNSKGEYTLKLNTKVKVKSYNVKATSNGKSVTKKLKVLHVIKASNKKVKKSKKVTKVIITLKKVNGKYLKSKVLKIKFKGKTYKVKTNKKGKATWKVKKSMLKKLKVGKKYKYKVTYGKDVVTKKLTIKK